MDLVKSFPGGWTGISIAAFSIAASTTIAVDDDAFHAMAVEMERTILGGPLIREPAAHQYEEQALAERPAPIHKLPCDTSKWHTYIAEAARRFDVLQRWIDALVRAESAGCVFLDGRPTTSPAGAMGLMQLMPRTWETYRDRLALGSDPHEPRDNIFAGTAYLRDLYDRFGWPGAAAAYHAGPARYSEYLSAGRPLPSATLEYLTRIDRILGVQPQVAPTFSRASRESAAADPRMNRATAAPSASAPAVDPAIDPDADRMSHQSLFVPLRHGARASQAEPQVPADVQTK